ncbi:MAG: hypothetical protein LWY06_01400 [Firmicutes bacterium]|nr:hypothetical protein [Bacillota bacterium]
MFDYTRINTFKKFPEKHFHKGVISALLAVMLFLFISASPAGAENYPPGIMLSKDVKDGMRGYGLTVFKGTTIEKFPVVVVGRLKNHIADSDMILVRLEGGYPYQYKMPIIAGMSGSPVYINGKLIGAIGYGFPFSKEPIGGVTPIEAMLREMPEKVKQADSGTDIKTGNSVTKKTTLAKPVTIDGKTYSKAVITGAPVRKNGAYPKDTLVMSPVASLLQLQGFSDKTCEMARKEFEPYGIEPLAIPGGGKAPAGVDYSMQPGSAVGVTFLEGDMYIGGNGTLTYRQGNKILAFGHPLMNLGNTELPMQKAFIQTVLPNYYLPYKFSSSAGSVGTFVYDGLFAASGILGRKTTMIPITVDVHEEKTGAGKKYNLRCLRHKSLTGPIMMMAVNEAVQPFSHSANERSAKVDYYIKLKGYEPVKFSDFTAGDNIGSAVSMQFAGYLRTLIAHNFEPFDFENVSVKVTILPEDKTLTIKDVSTRMQKVGPGDVVPVTVRLQDKKGKMITRNMNVTVPATIRKGLLKIGITGGANQDRFEKKLQLLPVNPYNKNQLVYRIEEQPRGNELVATTMLPTETISYAGERLLSLSRTKVSVFKSSPRSTVNLLKDYLIDSIQVDGYVEGEEILAVMVSQESASSSQEGESQSSTGSSSSASNGDYGEYAASSMGNVKKKLLEMPGETPEVVMAAGSEAPKDTSKPINHTGSFNLDISNQKDYFQGKFENTGITNGIVTLSRKMTDVFNSANPYIFSLYTDKTSGRIYAGESPSGRILCLSNTGEVISTLETGEIIISAITGDSTSNIYAATAPHGKILKIDAAGKLSVFCHLDDKCIWDLKIAPGGNLIAATGLKGRVWSIDSSGRAKMLFESAEPHIQCLDITSGGDIYAGGSTEGTVYRITPDGRVSTCFKSIETSIDSVFYDNGILWVASEELLFKIDGKGAKKAFIFPENVVLSVCKDSEGRITASTSDMGRVYRIYPNDRIENLFEAEINQVTKVIPAADGLIIATGNPGKIIKISGKYASEGAFTSGIIDAGRTSDFGNIQWACNIPTGASITTQTRTGDTLVPDKTWSDWSSEYSTREGQKIASTPGRYIQVKTNFKSDGTSTPELYWVSLFFKHKNHAPLLMLDTPDGGEKWSALREISWKTFLANPETLTFSLYLSPDNGKNWLPIRENINADLQKKGAAASDSERPIKMKYKVLTSRFRDGRYILKIRGFDRTDANNPLLSSEIISKPFVVANKAPELSILSCNELEDGRAVITGFVKTYSVNIGEVSYRLNESDWTQAFPQDGVFDNDREKFVIYLNKPYPSKFVLLVKATDEAGNSVVRDYKLSVTKGK